MPAITVLFWNVQNFGDIPDLKRDYGPLTAAIAQIVAATGADVLFVQEVKQSAVSGGQLVRLQSALLALPAPQNNWYCEWVKGAIAPNAQFPFATSNDLVYDEAHHEGYAVFWNQNSAKFTMRSAPPLPNGVNPPAANAQSEIVRSYGRIAFGNVVVPLYGIAVPNGGVAVPAGGTPYTLPTGTTAPGNAAIVGPNGNYLNAGQIANNDIPIVAGTVIPAGTQIGFGGLRMNMQVVNVAPVIVPQAFTLTDALTLPGTGTVMIPEHALSLALYGRDTQGSTVTGQVAAANFTPGFAQNWTPLLFTRGAGFPAVFPSARRPAFVTIDVNRPGQGAAARLIPIAAYHAPSASPASNGGLQRASFIRPMYQVYDGANWIDSQFAVLGGDNNVQLDPNTYAYAAWTSAFNNSGANSAIRVFQGVNPDTDVLNKTTIQLNTQIVGGNPVINANTNAYRRLAIDNVFYRGFGGPNAPILVGPAIDLAAAFAAVALPWLPQFNAIQTLANAFNAVQNNLVPAGITNVVNPRLLVLDIANGQFNTATAFGEPPPARRVAEFLRLCLSDHLPVAFSMSFP